jgi:hypothetical protein
METDVIPNYVVGLILSKMKVKNILGDICLEKFIVKYGDMNHDTMMYWLIKKQRYEALAYYTHINKNRLQYLSQNTIISFFITSIKNKHLMICKHLLNVFESCMNETIITKIIDKLIIDYLHNCGKIEDSEDNVINNIIDFIIYIKQYCRTNLVDINISNCIPIKHIPIILKKPNTKRLITTLSKHEMLDKCVYYIRNLDNEELSLEIINNTIIYNHITFLQYLVQKGYTVQVCDVIVGVDSSNIEMIRYLLSFFKPRLYSKGFKQVMLLLASKRNDDRIYELLKNKLK